MVVTEEVKDAMDQQRGQLRPEGMPCPPGLPIRRFGRYDHVPQQPRRERLKLPLPHREREDIGAIGDPPVPLVEPGHRTVTHQQQPAFRPPSPHLSEGGLPDLS